MLNIAIYLLLTWLGVRAIFNFSTYHRYFLYALPVLVVFAAATGWAYERILGLGHYWVSFLALFSALMFVVGRRQLRQGRAMLQLTDDASELRLLSESTTRTVLFFSLSAATFVVSWFGGLLVAFNS